MDPSECNIKKFMLLPIEEERHYYYWKFYKATSNHTVALAICAICGQEHNMHEDQVEYLSLKDIPDP